MARAGFLLPLLLELIISCVVRRERHEGMRAVAWILHECDVTRGDSKDQSRDMRPSIRGTCHYEQGHLITSRDIS